MDSNIKGEIARVDKAIANETQARTEAISNVNASISTLESSTTASVNRLDQAIADESAARAQAISGVNASISTLDSKVTSNITRIDKAIADETQARTEAISGVNASISSLENKTDASVSRLDKAIADEKSARTEAISGVNASISTLDSKVTSNVTRIDKAIADETKARTDAISNLNSSLTSTINSKVSEVSTALSTHEASSAEKFSQISASFEAVNSSITEWSQTMTTADDALSTKIDQLTVTVNGNTTAIETTSKALTDFKGNVDASWSIKIATDNNGRKYATGMSLGLTGSGSNVQSQCIFLVDRFVLMTAANGTYQTPFYVTNGAMYVREAFIKDASIGTAKIADAAITMAKIVNEIKSSNYVAGSNGWRITKDGSSEFNNVVVRGEVHANSGKFKGTVEATAFVGDVASMSTIPESSFPKQSGTASRTVTKHTLTHHHHRYLKRFM